MRYGTGGSYRQSIEYMRRQHTQKRYSFGTQANTCHTWAEQNPDIIVGQSADGRIRFNGRAIYSYGEHFPMAIVAGEYRGRRVVLFNADSYSVTTSGHQSEVRSALRGRDDIIIPLSGLKAFDYRKPDKADIARAHTELLERQAAAMGPQGNRPSWQTESEWRDEQRRDISDTTTRLEAFRHMYKVRSALPADPVAWLAKRKERAARKAQREKLAWAIGQAKTPVRLAGAPSADLADTWRAEDHVRALTGQSRVYGSARHWLARNGGKPAHIAKCSAAMKAIGLERDAWQSALAGIRARAQRASDLRTLAAIERDGPNYLKGYWLSEDDLGRLWALAIAEDMPEAAAIVARTVHEREWQAVVPDTFKRHQRKEVTLEQWLAGKGSASELSSNVTLVRRKGDSLETSLGAVVPWSHAIRVFRMVQACRLAREGYQRNGHTVRVGTFAIDRIAPDGTLVAGCHTIGFDAMLSLAVRELPASEILPCYPLPVPMDVPRGMSAVRRAAFGR